MALSLQALGRKETQEFTYTARDTILYALGIGALENELPYLYEGEQGKGARVYPTFATVPSFPACESLFRKLEGNLHGLVHAAQSMKFHAEFPSRGTLRTEVTVSEVYDLKRMAQVILSGVTKDISGKLLAEANMTLFFRFDGNFGGEPPPKREVVKYPDRDPDWTFHQVIPKEQALLYRLNGDLNPLHADPEFAKQAGFDRPILHGLCTYGYVARAICLQGLDGNSGRLKSLSGQFRNPVRPGDTIQINGWNQSKQIWVQASVIDSEKKATVVFDRALADIA